MRFLETASPNRNRFDTVSRQVLSKTVHGEAFGKDEIEIPADLAPGDYFLQEEVISQPRNGKPVRAWQWAELRVEPK